MKKVEKVRSTVKPEERVLDDYSVWVYQDIKEIKEKIGEEDEFIGYEYTVIQYDKDEYINTMMELQSEQITDIQLALVEVYESMGV